MLPLESNSPAPTTPLEPQSGPGVQSGPGPQSQPQPTPPPKRPWWHWVLAGLVWIWRHLGYRGRIMVATLAGLMAIGLFLTLVHAIFPGSPSSSRTSSTSGSSSSSSSSLSGSSYQGVVANKSDLLQSCGASGRALSRLPRYHTGKAPYATQLLVQSTFAQTKQYTGSVPTDILANPTLKPALGAQIPQTQLIACLDRTGEVNTGKSCNLSTKLPIYDATYRLTVYEAQSHRQLLAMDIPSLPIDPAATGGNAVGCPTQAYYNPSDPRLYYPPNDSAIVSALMPLVQ